MGLREQRAKVNLAKSVVQQAVAMFLVLPSPQRQRALADACDTLLFEYAVLSNMRTEEITPERQEVS